MVQHNHSSEAILDLLSVSPLLTPFMFGLLFTPLHVSLLTILGTAHNPGPDVYLEKPHT